MKERGLLTKRAVLIHKTPSSWQKLKALPHDNALDLTQVESLLNPLDSTQIPTDIIDTDIYTSLLREITGILGFEELHIVQGFDSNEKRNWQSAEQSGFARLDDRTMYSRFDGWILALMMIFALAGGILLTPNENDMR